MSKFIISTDSSADLYLDFIKQNNIHCIVMKRIVNSVEIGEIYNSESEFDRFYEELKQGKLSSTTQLNCYELEQYFLDILDKEAEGDIIHIGLSSGLSGSLDNAKSTAEQINKTLAGRKIYVLDSLIATGGIAMLIDRAIAMRDSGTSTDDAIQNLIKIRDCQQGWVIVGDLFHLKRGGRISGFKAALGTLFGVKPIITVSKKGCLAIESTIKGNKKSIQYVLSKIEERGVKANESFFNSTLYILRTSKSDIYNELLESVKSKYPNLKVKEMIVGPIIGTHLGDNCAAVIFEGQLRDDI